MALINCPECGKENISSSATACPNCGFDIKGWQKKLDEERIAQEKVEKEQANLRFQAERENEERQRIINSIPDPALYGIIWVYPVVIAVGILFTIIAGPFWIIAALVGCGAYFAYSYLEYKKWLDNPESYKIEKAARIAERNAAKNGAEVIQPTTTNYNGVLFCPKCGSEDVTKQVFQENRGSRTITHTKSKYKEQGHGCLWWLLIGWWWWIVDLFLWIFFFVPRLIIRLFAAPFKRKKYKGKSTSVSETVNDIAYRTMCTCQKCGNTWSF
jgi:hypothetical protein